MRHHPGGLPHEFADRARQVRATGALRLLPMTDFVMTHGLDDGTTAQVAIRQTVQMTLQMAFHLSFGFGDEPQAGTVSQQCCQGPDTE